MDTRKLEQDENIVAFMDILGFSKIARALSLDDLEKRIRMGLTGHIQFGQLLSSESPPLDPGREVDLNAEAQAVSAGVMSDTVVLYVRDRDSEPLRALCRAASVVFNTVLTEQWLLRGAIDVGPFRCITEPRMIMFIGGAVVAAHELQQSQDWGGCVLTTNVCDRFPEEVARLRCEGLVVDYDVPFKQDCGTVSRRYTALNWCWWSVSNDRPAILRSMLKSTDNDRAAAKVQATIDFLEAMRHRGRYAVGGPGIGVDKVGVVIQQKLPQRP